MLDVTLFKGAGWSTTGVLNFRPRWKASSLGVPSEFRQLTPFVFTRRGQK